jgi:type II secretory pathway predicted ATPase ExeA
MFFDIFGLSQHPFAENPPIDHLWGDDRMAQALARLEFFSLTASLALITGPTGSGKSCLLRLYRQALPQNRFQTVYLNLTHLNPVAMLRLMVGALGGLYPCLGLKWAKIACCCNCWRAFIAMSCPHCS